MPTFDRSAGVTWMTLRPTLLAKRRRRLGNGKAPATTTMANPFAISNQKRFTALNPIPAHCACYETALSN